MTQELAGQGTPRSGRSRGGFDRGHVRHWRPIGMFIITAGLAFGAGWVVGGQIGGTSAGGAGAPPHVPAVEGFYEGTPVWFIHTEASDQDIAGMLAMMMGSPVLTVPSLADVPGVARGLVYAFANGVKPNDLPAGPLGFQPDVFDSAPPDRAYTPLREVVKVTWQGTARPRLLTSAEQIAQAERAGEVRLERTGAVVNMPFLSWPGGQR